MFLVKLKKQPKKKKELCVTEKNKRFNPKFFYFGVWQKPLTLGNANSHKCGCRCSRLLGFRG